MKITLLSYTIYKNATCFNTIYGLLMFFDIESFILLLRWFQPSGVQYQPSWDLRVYMEKTKAARPSTSRKAITSEVL